MIFKSKLKYEFVYIDVQRIPNNPNITESCRVALLLKKKLFVLFCHAKGTKANIRIRWVFTNIHNSLLGCSSQKGPPHHPSCNDKQYGNFKNLTFLRRNITVDWKSEIIPEI